MDNKEVQEFWSKIEKDIREKFPELLTIRYHGEWVTVITPEKTFSFIID